MFRTFTITAAVLLGLFAGTSVTTGTATAHEPQNLQAAYHCHYDVYYRHCAHECWSFYGSYDCSCEAYRAARRLGYRGYHTRVVRHHE